MKASNILVLADEKSVFWDPWARDILSCLHRFPGVVLVDRLRAVEDQLRDAKIVVDANGEAAPQLAEAAAGSVELWQFPSVGVDHYDLDALHRAGIVVANVPGTTSARALAEHALLLSMMVLRRYRAIDAEMRAGREINTTGHELAGRRILIIGFGASGRELARLSLAFGMSVSVVRRAGADAGLAAQFGLTAMGAVDDLDDMLDSADIVSLHLPLSPGTRGILNSRRMNRLGVGAIVINVSRGGLIDETALLHRLDSGLIAGAGLDVLSREPFDPHDPLISHPLVTVTPHVAGQTYDTSRRRAQFVADNVARVIGGEPPMSMVLP